MNGEAAVLFNVGYLYWILPEILLCALGFLVLLLGALWKDPARTRALGWFTLAVLLLTAVLVPALFASDTAESAGRVGPGQVQGAFHDRAAGEGPEERRPTFVVDGFTLVFQLIFLAAGALTVLMSLRFLDLERSQGGEFYALVLFAVLGAMFLAGSTDFITLFIGLETMSLSVYVLVGWVKHNRKSNEAAMKYFLLGAFASGLMLYGISLVYGATGTTNLLRIREVVSGALPGGVLPAGPDSTFLMVGLLFVIVGLAFKMAAVPFHMWTPDAYEGAPTVITAFMSTAVKAAAFAMALRVLLLGFPDPATARIWTPMLAILAALTMTVGNWVAILQDNMKRLLAYSSIAHAGYALLGVVAVGAALSGGVAGEEAEGVIRWGQISVVLYLIAYTFTNMGAFALVVMLRREGKVGDRVEDFAGMASKAPVAAAAMLIFLLSLAGIPPLAGFIGKWWVFGAAIKGGYAWLAVVAVVNSAVSLYYYMRVVVMMYIKPAPDAEPYGAPLALATACGVSLLFTLAIGLYPQPFIRLASYALLGG
jgi:NADH-quinone oxidoreductase subunit N